MNNGEYKIIGGQRPGNRTVALVNMLHARLLAGEPCTVIARDPRRTAELLQRYLPEQLQCGVTVRGAQ